jgi:hypothetical protein
MTFSRKSHRLWDNVEKSGGDWWATNEVTIWSIRVAAGLARLRARTRMHTLMRPGIHVHARTHRPISNNFSFSTATVIRERASLLRYTCIACLVIFIFCFCQRLCLPSSPFPSGSLFSKIWYVSLLVTSHIRSVCSEHLIFISLNLWKYLAESKNYGILYYVILYIFPLLFVA